MTNNFQAYNSAICIFTHKRLAEREHYARANAPSLKTTAGEQMYRNVAQTTYPRSSGHVATEQQTSPTSCTWPGHEPSMYLVQQRCAGPVNVHGSSAGARDLCICRPILQQAGCTAWRLPHLGRRPLAACAERVGRLPPCCAAWLCGADTSPLGTKGWHSAGRH